MNIVVLAGGLSSERDVSLKSGSMVLEALRSKGYNVLLMDVFLGLGDENTNINDVFLNTESYSMEVGEITSKAPDIEKIKSMRTDKSNSFFGPNVISICQKADMVFMALHGEDGENGKVQATFDLFGITYSGTGYLGSALAMDKGLSKHLFRINNIPTPSGITLNKETYQEEIIADIKIPCVVKPCCGGSSIGVSVVKNKETLIEAIEEAFLYESEIVVEDYIKGREFSVGVLDGKALPVIEIAPIEGFYDYVNKYKVGSAVETCPAILEENLTKKMQHYAIEVVKALDLGSYCRMDFLLDEENNMYCLEANTLPGMTATSLLPQEAKAVGIEFTQLCEKIVKLSLDKK